MEKIINGKCLSPDLDRKFAFLWHLVGNTPILQLHYTYKGKPDRIYVKCENYNLTGSIKDRIALYIMYQAYMNCQISSTDRIVEATSGTGIAFSIGKTADAFVAGVGTGGTVMGIGKQRRIHISCNC